MSGSGGYQTFGESQGNRVYILTECITHRNMHELDQLSPFNARGSQRKGTYGPVPLVHHLAARQAVVSKTLRELYSVGSSTISS
jgi:hypothetical protein